MTAIVTPAKRARTIKQFVADYGVGRTFTYAEIKAGRLRAVKAGDRTLILQNDSEAWARSLPELTPTAESSEAA